MSQGYLANKEAALARVEQHLKANDVRTIIGIVGKPGSGKSTLSAFLRSKLPTDEVSIVPMDGYHFRNQQLALLGRSERKGAPDTFDVESLRDLLSKIRREVNQEVTFPIFDRSIEEPIDDAGSVSPSTRVIIVEGNYLLHDEDGWGGIRDLLDETWMVDVDEGLRMERLIARHIQFGKAPDAARAWATGTDQRNAELIEKGRARADFIVRLD